MGPPQYGHCTFSAVKLRLALLYTPMNEKMFGRPAGTPDRSALLATTSHEDAKRTTGVLTGLGFTVVRVSSYRLAIQEMTKYRFTLVLTDVHLGDGGWKDILSQAVTIIDAPRVILLANAVDAGLCAEAISLGAYDVLARPLNEQEVRCVAALAFSPPRKPVGSVTHAAGIAVAG